MTLTRYKNARQFIQAVDALALELLWDHKKGFINSKNILLDHCENMIVDVWEDSDDVDNSYFRKKWITTYQFYYMAAIYEHYFKVTNNGVLADVYSDAFGNRFDRFIIN